MRRLERFGDRRRTHACMHARTHARTQARTQHPMTVRNPFETVVTGDERTAQQERQLGVLRLVSHSHALLLKNAQVAYFPVPMGLASLVQYFSLRRSS